MNKERLIRKQQERRAMSTRSKKQPSLERGGPCQQLECLKVQCYRLEGNYWRREARPGSWLGCACLIAAYTGLNQRSSPQSQSKWLLTDHGRHDRENWIRRPFFQTPRLIGRRQERHAWQKKCKMHSIAQKTIDGDCLHHFHTLGDVYTAHSERRIVHGGFGNAYHLIAESCFSRNPAILRIIW